MKILTKYNLNLQNSLNLKTALTHSSYANIQRKECEHYERIEYLGDAVLQLVVSDYLYSNTKLSEGAMSKKRASFVCENALNYYANKINLKPYVKVGPKLEVNESILADVFEGVIGALFLDRGFEAAKDFIYSVVVVEIKKDMHFFDDYKTLMQEYCQTSRKSINYTVVEEYGEAHDKTFIIELKIDDIIYGKGTGKSKKEAEQKAARDAYEKSVK